MQELWSVYFTLISHTLALVTYRMDQHCGGSFPGHNGYGQISFKFSPHNTSHYDCAFEVYSIRKLMVAFVNVNLPNSVCGEVNISLTKYHAYEQRDIGFSGIPVPLCKSNIPWSEFPSPVYKLDGSYLKVRFQGGPATPQNTGFELKFVAYYYYGCEQGTYKCKNYKCIPTSAHNCDGIDWCGDSSGCEPNWGLIGGLIGGIGSAFLGLCIGGCLVCRLKMKSGRSRNESSHVTPDAISRYIQHTRLQHNLRQNEQSNRTQNHAESSDTTSRNARLLELRYDIMSRNTRRLEPRNDTIPSNVSQYEDERPWNTADLNPPSYASVQDVTTNINDAAPPPNRSSTEAGSQAAGNQPEQYVPPPPEYDMVVRYKDIYKVSETEPSYV